MFPGISGRLSGIADKDIKFLGGREPIIELESNILGYVLDGVLHVEMDKPNLIFRC